MERLPVTSIVFKVFLRCQIVLEPLHSWSVKKHEWSKYAHVKNSPVVSWRNPKWKLLLRERTKASSFFYDWPSLGWYICRLKEFPANSRVCLYVCAFVCELKGSWDLYKSSFLPHHHHHLCTTIRETSECPTFTLAQIYTGYHLEDEANPGEWALHFLRVILNASQLHLKEKEERKKINQLPAADFLEYTEENTFAPRLYRSMYLTNNAHILYFA